MLPDLCPALLFEIIEFLLTEHRKLAYLLGRQRVEINELEGVLLFFDDLMIAQNPTDHLLSDLLVVLDLTFVMNEDACRDIPYCRLTAVSKQGHQHDRLIDVRHAHRFFDECF